ncbi:hypothetical protein VC83_02615 [Pseudogymnoascus destructans]|uniref:Uncharacterized protein n=2 Tax=Pseudogymnoascus destructans TaxID=655981 RepID=L8G5T5_PSED2|nr:uncharacterized protein VC83_02615 [Pseudogymnoascus destructans]ELR08038.1 hypothetical protein GMDG_02876 [Pseudogymnoascus destructans 20631-21]OAF61010.1 hypothetical protein VC83_02615 [Pseudogymnoascus destructans]
MCGDSHLPPAPSVGNAVAVIHLRPEATDTTSTQRMTPTTSSWRCQLSNCHATENEGNTRLLYDAKPNWWCGDMKLRIHTYGTPSNATEQHNPIFHQMLIRSCEANSSSVGRKLELDTTNNGVIGRTMSVEVLGQVIGEGIIGRF